MDTDDVGREPAATRDDLTLVRSAERLRTGTVVRVRGGQRLEKYVVTETVQQTVEVRRERLRVVELGVEELTARWTAAGHTDEYEFRDHEFEIVLHEERVVVSTAVVPVERIRVRTHVVTELVDVGDTVRAEQVELESTGFGTEPQSSAEPTGR